ncbi:FAD:protein FMN transferase [Amycolatopsis taiwanensis]|uniref:FAD:protein FMN transferase n=1 Tax=Amycolatopsis taiwanensis TaxID=342230 RepID=A0A9W6QXN7_9PSEU|nr:FAD:protein FMN transferase [Amycolatopsis taiwanensis]GLY65628.1 FAD:protein FMN transferase [Amycolatopsis taiwanensis]
MRRVEHIMGLPVSLHTPHGEPGDAAFAWLREADRRFSPFRPGSEVCGGEASPELIEILDLCAEFERDSGGAFRARLPGRPLDPCGVVKGWAVQRAAELLRAEGIRDFCLNAGGDVVAAGEPEPGRPWSVGIRHPDLPHEVCAVFAIRDRAVATSGSYERGAHIIDGRTGRPAGELVSLTVIADDLTIADATSTAAFAMGAEGIEWAAARPGCTVFAVDADRKVFSTAGTITL